MRILDENGVELKENEIDLSVGYLAAGTAIKADAKPIDNVTKFAWDDGDYEAVWYYCLNLEASDAPTQEERLAELEALMDLLLGVNDDE